MEEKNAQNVLEKVEKYIQIIEQANKTHEWLSGGEYHMYGYYPTKWGLSIGKVYDELSIFDWWKDCLTLSNLKEMQIFLKTAIKNGFTGYVCFKVGVTGCANGMWASTKESDDGYSPKDGDTLYHSFVHGSNYWDVEVNGEWLAKKIDKPYDKVHLNDLKKVYKTKTEGEKCPEI